LGFTPFLHIKIEKGKKHRRKTVGIQKREKKGSEKERKKGYCEQPYCNTKFLVGIG
jgi:hypothetical protein